MNDIKLISLGNLIRESFKKILVNENLGFYLKSNIATTLLTGAIIIPLVLLFIISGGIVENRQNRIDTPIGIPDLPANIKIPNQTTKETTDFLMPQDLGTTKPYLPMERPYYFIAMLVFVGTAIGIGVITATINTIVSICIYKRDIPQIRELIKTGVQKSLGFGTIYFIYMLLTYLGFVL